MSESSTSVGTTQEWPRPWEEILLAPNASVCPERCPFTPVCDVRTQQGMAEEFKAERIKDPWECLWYENRVALVDHELEHCGMDDKGRFCLLPHDLEEFQSIVRRWGLWRSDVANFVDAATSQMELQLTK